MKKLLCGVLIVVMMLSLVACGTKLSGTYKTDGNLLYQAYTFDGNKVTVKTYVAGAKVLEFEGTYEISGDEITITYAEDEETGDALAAGTYEFEKTDDGIKIGKIELTKK